MRLSRPVLACLPAILLVHISLCIVITHETASTQLLPAYDYVVVGGGLSGLVVGNRLSEDPNVKVLILEAGELDDRNAFITYPAHIGYEINSKVDWSLSTTRQEWLDNQTRPYLQGRAVGGSTIIHGMVWTRGSRRDFDAWEALGNPGWSWDDLLPYFLKSENYTSNLDVERARALGIDPDMSLHGTSGPIEVAFPHFVYNHSHSVLEGYAELGIPILKDMNSGSSAGAVFSPSSMRATNQSRCDARSAYLDPYMDRPNMHVAVGQTVTRLWLADADASFNHDPEMPFPGLKYVREVEFASVNTTARTLNTTVRGRVSASREVIMASGAIFTPTILQVSGIGPRPVLEQLGIPVKIDLPGVGGNYQDHPMAGVTYNYTKPGLFTPDNIKGPEREKSLKEYIENRTGPLTAPMISIVAFPSLEALSKDWDVLTSKYMEDSFEKYLPEDTHSSVKRGYEKQSILQLEMLRRADEPASEIMTDSNGRFTVAVQSTMSRGTVRPRGPDILDNGMPLIDPRYCSHPLDCEVAVLSFRLNARLMKTSAMSAAVEPSPPAPFASADDETDTTNNDELLWFLKKSLTTEFHPSGTTAMLPLDDGGVVDPNLRVYGATNLRIVDAGIMPLLPAAHIQAAAYAVAEKAADMIKQDWAH